MLVVPLWKISGIILLENSYTSGCVHLIPSWSESSLSSRATLPESACILKNLLPWINLKRKKNHNTFHSLPRKKTITGNTGRDLLLQSNIDETHSAKREMFLLNIVCLVIKTFACHGRRAKLLHCPPSYKLFPTAHGHTLVWVWFPSISTLDEVSHFAFTRAGVRAQVSFHTDENLSQPAAVTDWFT